MKKDDNIDKNAINTVIMDGSVSISSQSYSSSSTGSRWRLQVSFLWQIIYVIVLSSLMSHVITTPKKRGTRTIFIHAFQFPSIPMLTKKTSNVFPYSVICDNHRYDLSPSPRRQVFAAVFGTATTTTTKSATNEEGNKTRRNKRAVVVGGGPGGLAAALMLSNLSRDAGGPYDVIILEQARPSSTPGGTSGEDDEVDPTSYDVSRAFLYLIDLRGQTACTKRYPRVQHALTKIHGVGLRGYNIMRVPPSPEEAVPQPISLPIVWKQKEGEDSYWVPRHVFVSMLRDEIEIQQQERREIVKGGGKIGEAPDRGIVTFISGMKCVKVEPVVRDTSSVLSQDSDNTVRVCAEPRLGYSTPKKLMQEFFATLVIGADGIRSNVRASMSQWPEYDGNNKSRFHMNEKPSPAGGLRYKVLQYPPNFTIPQNDGTKIQSVCDLAYVFASANTSPTSKVRLGMLPIRDSKSIRPVNVITKPDHELWNITMGEEMREWFAKSFPRMPFQSEENGGMISNAEWDRFAQSLGGRFPIPQYCEGMQCCTFDGKGGVVLIGDALHSFPPDIGQGVNSALGDVAALEQSLLRCTGNEGQKEAVVEKSKDEAGECESNTTNKLSSALKDYEETRGPQIKSLLRLCAGSNPLQYSQPGFVLELRKKMWSLNFFFRLLLNKVTGGFVPHHTFVLLQNQKLTYTQIMKRADTVTALLTGIMSVLAGKLVLFIFGK